MKQQGQVKDVQVSSMNPSVIYILKQGIITMEAGMVKLII